MARNKTASEAILSILKRGPKKGLTASAIADRGGLNLNTTRTALYSLTSSGEVVVAGSEPPSFGRPAYLYAQAA